MNGWSAVDRDTVDQHNLGGGPLPPPLSERSVMELVKREEDLAPDRGGDALLTEWDGSKNHVQWWHVGTWDDRLILVEYDDGLRHIVDADYFYAHRVEGYAHPTRTCRCAWAPPGPKYGTISDCGRRYLPRPRRPS